MIDRTTEGRALSKSYSLPLELRERIVAYLLANDTTCLSTPIFPPELPEWNALVLQRIWNRQYVYPSVIGSQLVNESYKSYTRELAVMSSSCTRPREEQQGLNAIGRLHPNLLNFLSKGWPNIHKLELMYEQSIDPWRLVQCIKEHLPQLRSIKLKVSEEEAQNTIEALSRSVIEEGISLKSLSMYIKNSRPRSLWPSITMTRSEQAWSTSISRMPNALESLELFRVVISPLVLRSIMRFQRRLKRLTMAAHTHSFDLAGDALGPPQPTFYLTALSLTHVVVNSCDDVLAFQGARMFPWLRELTIDQVIPSTRNVHHSDHPGQSRREQYPYAPDLFNTMFSVPWPSLRRLKLPYIHDALASSLSRNTPNLVDLHVKYMSHASQSWTLGPPHVSFNIGHADDGVPSSPAPPSLHLSAVRHPAGPHRLTNKGFLALVQGSECLQHLQITTNQVSTITAMPHQQYPPLHDITSDVIYNAERREAVPWRATLLRKLAVVDWVIDLETMGHLLAQLPYLATASVHVCYGDSCHSLRTWPRLGGDDDDRPGLSPPFSNRLTTLKIINHQHPLDLDLARAIIRACPSLRSVLLCHRYVGSDMYQQLVGEFSHIKFSDISDFQLTVY